jgi:hypothetical protein
LLASPTFAGVPALACVLTAAGILAVSGVPTAIANFLALFGVPAVFLSLFLKSVMLLGTLLLNAFLLVLRPCCCWRSPAVDRISVIVGFYAIADIAELAGILAVARISTDAGIPVAAAVPAFSGDLTEEEQNILHYRTTTTTTSLGSSSPIVD